MKRQLSAFFDLGFRPEPDTARSRPRADISPSAFPPAAFPPGDFGPPSAAPRLNVDAFRTMAVHVDVPDESKAAAGGRARGPFGAIIVFVIIVAVAAIAWFVAKAPTLTAFTVHPAVTGFVLLVVGALVLGALATLVHLLRRQKNPLYWQLACWLLVVLGIVVRQLVAPGSATISVGLFGTSAAVGIAILPGLMRWLNKIAKTPGLQHVAVPFSLGFFLDLAQVMTSHYIVHLPWVPK